MYIGTVALSGLRASSVHVPRADALILTHKFVSMNRVDLRPGGGDGLWPRVEVAAGDRNPWRGGGYISSPPRMGRRRHARFIPLTVVSVIGRAPSPPPGRIGSFLAFHGFRSGPLALASPVVTVRRPSGTHSVGS